MKPDRSCSRTYSCRCDVSSRSANTPVKDHSGMLSRSLRNFHLAFLPRIGARLHCVNVFRSAGSGPGVGGGMEVYCNDCLI